MNYGQAPFGLRQVKLVSMDNATTVTLSSVMMLHVTPKFTTTQFTVEGIVVAGRGVMSHVEWELEAGGITLEAYQLMTSQVLSSTGTTPNRTMTLDITKNVELPYFRVYGRARGEGNDDIHCKLYRCQLTAIEGTYRQGEFWITSCGGIAVYRNATEGIFEFVQHETQVAL